MELGQARVGIGPVKGGGERRAKRRTDEGGWFHLGIEEMDEGMRISCHDEEKVSVPSLFLSLSLSP